jgi:hypothetical protein
MRIRTFALIAIVHTGLLATTNAFAQGTPQAPVGPTFEKGPPVQCMPNEGTEWRASDLCGFPPAEFRCWNFYQASSRSCERKCTWTGKCGTR